MRTLLPPHRILVLQTLMQTVRHANGCIIEVGVFTGGSLILMAKELPHRFIFGYDTFEGLPPNKWREGEIHLPGEFHATRQQVENTLREEKITNVSTFKGLFPSQVSPSLPVAFAHLDVDFYESTMDALEFLWPILIPGGIIVVDDYDTKDCPGVGVALRQFAAQENVRINSHVEGQAWIMRDHR
jgi:O-methyltransferase